MYGRILAHGYLMRILDSKLDHHTKLSCYPSLGGASSSPGSADPLLTTPILGCVLYGQQFAVVWLRFGVYGK